MRKICVFTGTRADYGLLRPLMTAIRNDPAMSLQVLVTGMHLSPEFGLTYKEIERDGFSINEKVEILLSSGSSAGISKAVGLGLISFCDSLKRLKPDLLIILGDRFEAFSIATAAMLSGVIPIAHLHGGEATFGVIDEPIRHSITKMSHLHFTSTEKYRQRVIQLGEKPERVFNVGALGVENIKTIDLLTKKQLAKVIGFSPDQDFALVTFHPVTLEQNSAEKQFTALLSALAEFPEMKIIFTKANADTDSRIINQLIDRYIDKEPERCRAFSSMGQLNYLSAMRYCRAVVGNSSSGIIEAPSLHIPTINIGNRQQGRLHSDSVIDCVPDTKAITMAIRTALTGAFQATLRQSSNPYEKADTVKNIVRIIKQTNIDDIIRKEFYDLSAPRPL